MATCMASTAITTESIASPMTKGAAAPFFVPGLNARMA